MGRIGSGWTPNTAVNVTRASAAASAHPTWRVLLLGAGGQLGSDLARALPVLGEVRALTRADLDLADAAHFETQLCAQLDAFEPDVIVNAAAYTAVDHAQTDVQTAMQVNADAVRVLAQQAKARGCMLLHYSTDYVFDGQGHTPWTEDDAPHPLSVYGQSKWAGEQAMAEVGARACVLRTSWVVGAHGNNFLKTMLRLASEKTELRVVADQIGAPTSVALLSEVSVALIRQMVRAEDDDARWGTYHVAPAGETSWHGYAVYAIAQAQQKGWPVKLDVQAIQAIRTEDYPLPAPRPRNSRLNTAKLRRHFALTLPSWQQGIDAVIDDILRGQPS